MGRYAAGESQVPRAQGAKLFREWIRKEVADNTPYDEFARKVITATGSNKDNPPASYYQNPSHSRGHDGKHDPPFPCHALQLQQVPRPSLRALDPGQLLRNGRLLRPSGTEGGPRQREEQNRRHRRRREPSHSTKLSSEKRRRGEARTHRRSHSAQPSPTRPTTPQRKRRPVAISLPEWITSPDNRYFASSYANRVWGYMMGTGIIEPLDDIRAGNPPSNPELLNWLTKHFIEAASMSVSSCASFVKSRTYQLSIEDQQVERGRHHQLLPRQGPTPSCRSSLRHHSCRHWSQQPLPRSPQGHPRRFTSRCRRQTPRWLPRQLWSPGARKLLRMRTQ